MKLVSNVHLINHIGKKLLNYSSMRSEKNKYTEHLINLYERLNLCFTELYYLDLNINFEKIISHIEENKYKINQFYDLYKELDAEFDAKTIKTREELSKYLAKLSGLRNTKKFEVLKIKMHELLDNLLAFNKVLKSEELDIYIERLQILDDMMISFSEKIDNDNRKEYQREYNRILKELKKEFVDSMEDEI